MRLLRLHVENFGILQNYHMEPSSGLNVLCHENGWGKSTLAVFIKAMFYGLPASSKRSLDENERKKYTPWQGGPFGGSLEFETVRGRFRIERFFGAKESGDSVVLYDLSNNKPTDVYRDPFGEALFGIDADGFERTVYLSQRVMQKNDNNSIAAKLGNLLDDVDDIGGYDDAIEALDKRRQFYVKTGNRGRVAELDEQLNDRRRSFEELLRVRDTLIQKENDYDEKMRELTERKQMLRAVRDELGRAGLLRERAAHLERKNQMLSELEELDQTRRNAETALGGIHPTDADMEEMRKNLDALRLAKAKLDAIPAEPIQRKALRILPEEQAQSVPKGDLIEKLKMRNRELEKACDREAVLLSAQSNAAWRRFANGVPQKAQIDAVYNSFREAQKAERESETCASQLPSGRAPVLLILLLCLGAVLAILGFLPMLASFAAVILIGAAACVIGSVIGFVLHASVKKRLLRERDENALKYKQKAQTLMTSVKGFLARYGMDGSDPVRQLSELSVLANRFLEVQQALAQAGEEKRTLEEQKRQAYAFLIPSLRLFGIERREQSSYHAELEALSADLSMLEQVRADEDARRNKRAEADTQYRACQSRIKPFLDRFDPRREAPSAGECLRRVEQWETEWRRADGEYRQKNDTLCRFIQEKGLDSSDTPAAACADYEVLKQRERELQDRIDVLQNDVNRLTQEMNRLATDADRIGDAEAEILQLTEALEEAKGNHATVKRTMEFLAEAKTALSTRYLNDMQKSFSRFLSVLTSDEAPESVMDASFEVSLRACGKTHSMESFSRGWRDAVQFCTRLSLTDALYAEEEKPFLLLDDPFVNLDDRRLAAARHLLDTLAREYQIIYMVCHADRR